MEANAFDLMGLYMLIPLFKVMLVSSLMASAVTQPIGLALLVFVL